MTSNVSAPDASCADPVGLPLSRTFFCSLVITALAIALLTRFPYFGVPGFPIGEGGLFVRFSQLILDSGFVLPIQATYGGHVLPFAYPPAAFYLAAGVARVTGADLFSIFYWLPIVLNLLAVPAFCFVAAGVLRDRVAVATASIFYVQVAHSFIWQITGGGLPRSLAALFALLAIGIAVRTGAAKRWELILSGLLVGLAILSHLEWGIFAASGVALVIWTVSGFRRGFARNLLVGSTALLTIAPWLFLILSRLGAAPFLSSSTASEWSGATFFMQVITGGIFNILVWPAILGVFAGIRERNWFLILWTPLILLLTPRMGTSAGLAIPSAMLAGRGIKLAADFLMERIAADPELSTEDQNRLRTRRPLGLPMPALVLILLCSIVLSSPLRAMSADFSTLRQLTPTIRADLAWVRANTRQDARFAVVSDAQAWWADRIGEWFPLLADRESLTTAQGLEWAGPGVMTDVEKRLDELKLVQFGDPALVPYAMKEKYCRADHVAVFLPMGDPARKAFAESPDFQLVYHSVDTAVFRTEARPCPSVD